MFPRIVIGCVVLFALSLAVRAEEPKETKLKPTAVFSGSHSQIQKEKFVQVLTADDWKKLWEEHRGKDRRFTETEQSVEIDFETHYVMAIFFGDYPEGRVTPRQRGDIVLIGYKGLLYQTDLGAGTVDRRTVFEKAKEAANASYAFVVLPKPVKTVVIEQDVQGELGKPPIWKPRATFPAPKGK